MVSDFQPFTFHGPGTLTDVGPGVDELPACKPLFVLEVSTVANSEPFLCGYQEEAP